MIFTHRLPSTPKNAFISKISPIADTNKSSHNTHVIESIITLRGTFYQRHESLGVKHLANVKHIMVPSPIELIPPLTIPATLLIPHNPNMPVKYYYNYMRAFGLPQLFNVGYNTRSVALKWGQMQKVNFLF